MTHFMRSLVSFAAASAMLYPITIQPNAVENCADPDYHFVMSDAFGSTVPDTTNAKGQFCKTVAAEVALRN